MINSHSLETADKIPPREKVSKKTLMQSGLLKFLCMALICGSTLTATAANLVPLGTAANFTVLGGSTVTNTGATIITGDLGVSPGSAVTGFPPGIVVGTIHAADPTAAQAHADLMTAYTDAAGRASDTNLTGQDLGGLTLTPGVYTFNTSAFLTGNLILDGQGDPNAVFIFQMGTTLITSFGSQVILIGGTQASNVFWQVGSSATLGASSSFSGNILANTSITFNTGASLAGRALAINGAVTLDTNNVTSIVEQPVDLAVVKTDTPDPATVGQTLTYTITVSNVGNSTATGILATDTLPASVFFVTAASSGGACSRTGQIVTCSRASLAPAESDVITIQVLPTIAGTINNSVTVASNQSELNVANNTDTEMTTVLAGEEQQIDLAVVKTDSPDPASVGQPLTYTITATNVGNVLASGVIITDTLPDSVTFVSATSSGGACSRTGQIVTCSRPTLAPAESDVVTIQVIPNLPGTITNTVTVSAIQSDLNLANNTAIESTTILIPEGCQDLSGMFLTDPVAQCKTRKQTQSCKVTATFAVQNLGTIPSGKSDLTLYISNDAILDRGDTHIRCYKVKVLRSGTSAVKKIKFKQTGDVIGNYLFIGIDPCKLIPECNEQNNIIMSGPITAL